MWEHEVEEYVCCIPSNAWIFCMLCVVASFRCLKSVSMLDLKESKWKWRSLHHPEGCDIYIKLFKFGLAYRCIPSRILRAGCVH